MKGNRYGGNMVGTWRTIVVSVKHGSKIVSREFEQTPAQMLYLLPLTFFDAPHLSKVFTSSQDTIDHPLLGCGRVAEVHPGGVGWIGLDVDRRWVLDLQSEHPLDRFKLYQRKDRPLELCKPVKERFKKAPWKYRVRPVVRAGDKHHWLEENWEQGPRLGSDRDWQRWKRSLFAGQPDAYAVSLEIFPSLPVGWRILNAEADFPEKERGWRVSSVLGQMVATGWQDELMKNRTGWERFMEEIYGFDRNKVRAWFSRRMARENARCLDKVLSTANSPTLPRVRM